MSSPAHALLLTAGLGTRLRPLTLVRAKPALPVGGVPMARRIITWLADAGVTDVVLNLHHLPGSISAVVGDGSDLGVRARYSWEQPVVLGSAGGPRQALDIIGADTFFLVNGDTLTDLRLQDLAAAHAQTGALVTLAVIPNLYPLRYSGLRVAPDGAVVGVVPRGANEPSFHFIGAQVAHREAFASAPAGRPSNSIGEVYNALMAARPGSVRVHECDARFWDIGTVHDYWHTSHLFTTGETPTTVPGSILWDNVHLGDGCRLHRCIVTDGVAVPDGSTWTDSILIREPNGGVMAIPFDPERV